ncbi:M23 family metallopeptidase [Geobacter sp. DSM 9736]|uniref:M23 family metallopeptidase n=1 Tax=Geobacter sp. DSM 9736 TaxID=1277350 RepID=UPI000B500392|nr:M23 family metallopeptidase [Geobacter sp. DSM 9736]SNB45820.1 Murein DD-endopeptidase MepM and murein hydrolase activator NlpD, contain LysM domain [Geobacter sp. DSM 9736]
MKRSALLFFFILLVLASALGLYYFFGTPAPTVSISPDGGPVSAQREVAVSVDASGSVLRHISVVASQGDKSFTVFSKEYPGSLQKAKEAFTLAQAGLKEGEFKLEVKASNAPLHFGAGRTSSVARSFQYDNTPPAISVLSPAHNISHGGAGIVVYSVSKEVEKTGIIFHNRFIPGYRQGGNFYACLFPFPYNVAPEQFIPRVVAVDRAGNERQTGINYHLLRKSFPTDRITLSDPFLEKTAAEFKNKFPQITDPLEMFLKVNRELREQDAQALFQYARQTSPLPLWQGQFLRLPNSAPRGAFAQTRTYIYKGKRIDQQTHLGIDLASLAQSPVPAANSGNVVFSGDLGLYGQCVIIDHGLGLQSLYGHLSRTAVKTGDKVEKGQVIGNTGATGMAAGDHLHFGIVVSGIPVSPVEWWDPSWIKNNITGKLEMVRK